MTAKDVIFNNFNEYQIEENNARLKNVQKLIDFYNGEQKRYLKQYLKLRDLDDFPFYESDITKKIINKISEVYKKAPIRYFNEKRNDKYEALTQLKNMRMKTIERQSNLLGMIGVRPVVIERNGTKQFDYMILRSFTVYLERLKPVALKYLIQDGDERLWEYWSDDFHLIINSDNVPVDPGKAGYTELDMFGNNPYKTIPFVWLPNDFLIDDFYNTGNCADGLINANEHISLMLSEMAHKYRYTAFNPIYITGRIGQTDNVHYNYNKILAIDDEQATVGSLNINHSFADDVELIKFQVQLIERNYGLNINWGISGNTSGFSLVVQNIDHKDDLENMQEVCRTWEYDLLAMERIIGKKYNLIVPDAKKFRIDYAEVQMPISIEEKNKKWEFEFKNNLSSRGDYWRMQNPDITDEQIQEKIKQIGEENKLTKISQQTEPTISDIFNAK